jgi:hypothetical protein
MVHIPDIVLPHKMHVPGKKNSEINEKQESQIFVAYVQPVLH